MATDVTKNTEGYAFECEAKTGTDWPSLKAWNRSQAQGEKHMNTAKHTPGPWVAGKTNSNGDIYEERTGREIALISNMQDAEGKANKTLIMETPNLLAALQNVDREREFLEIMEIAEGANEKGLENIDTRTDLAAVWWRKANAELKALQEARKAAIAKATGATTSEQGQVGEQK